MLSNETRLRLASGLVLRPSGASVEIVVDGRTFRADARVLSLIELFAQPRTLGEALARLRSTSPEGFVETSSLLLMLERKGVLVPDAASIATTAPRGYEAPAVHVEMLDDRSRTAAFLRAIDEVVQPGDVVVDIGTGTGVLALAAARRGAKCVYAIEESAVAGAAEMLIAANGLSDVVRVLRGRSTQIELPERADVLVSEILGHDPLGEQLVPVVADARRRLLRKGGRTIPQRVSVLALPVDLPDAFIEKRTFTKAATRRWSEAYGCDFGALEAYSADMTGLGAIRPQELRAWPRVGDAVLLAEIALEQDAEVPPVAQPSFVTRASARHLGFVLYFEARLSSSANISTAPGSVQDDNHWLCRVFQAAGARSIACGETVKVEFSARTGESSLRSL